MQDILQVAKDILVQLLGGTVTTVLIGILISLVKKGQFNSWGKIAGRFLSKLGNARLGKTVWEKFEDVITISLVSFTQGLKEGADEDDKIVDKTADNKKK